MAPTTPDREAEIVCLYTTGETLTAIGAMVGCSKQTVRAILTRYGFPPRVYMRRHPKAGT